MTRLILSTSLLLLALGHADDTPSSLGPNSADEPKADRASLEKGAAFLDAVSLHWTEKRKCATCHTNVPYLMARPALGLKSSTEESTVRQFFEDQVARWERGTRVRPTYVVVTAIGLAFHDAATTKKLGYVLRFGHCAAVYRAYVV